MGKKAREKEEALRLRKTESLRQVLRIYDVSGRLLNDIKSMCVNSFAYIRVKEEESESFSGVRQRCVVSLV